MDSESVFRYSYCAKQNSEVQAIREKYLPREESKLDELKRLDNQVRTAGLPQALAAGIIGCLIFGLGMCIDMQLLAGGIVLGTLISLCGLAAMLAAYPLYRSRSRKAKVECQPRILELAEELIHN